MAQSVATDFFNPQILDEAVEAEFSGKNAFMGGAGLARLGAVVVSGSMPEGGPAAVGQTVTVPYFGTIGEFVENNADGSGSASALALKPLKQTSENATITRDSLGFEISRWSRGNALVNPNVGDPYSEASRQIMVAATRAMDKRCITAAGASGVYVNDVYSATVPRTIDWDLVLDTKFNSWGDEQEDVVGMIVHSHAKKDLLKLKDANGALLLVSSQNDGDFDRFNGLPVIVSDRVPVTGSTMSAVSSSGTSPPVATLTGTPLGAFRLVIDCVVGGAHATATVRFSTDGGNTWSANITTAAATVPFALTDTATDSIVGVNGATGLSVAFAAGTFNADNLWTSTASLKVMSLLVKRGALAFWYSSGNMGLETDKDIWKHTDQAAMHLYAAAHRYRRCQPGTKAGIAQIVHNVSGF